MIAAHADWSADPRKRFATVAERSGGRWRVFPPQPVSDPAGFAAWLIGGAPAVLGLDAPLGLPRLYAACHAGGYRDFPAFLASLAGRPGFFVKARRIADVSPAAPFFPARAERGVRRADLAAALGLPDAAALARACDRRTARRPAGAPPFWTLGANQSGSAAIAAWRDWLAPALAGGAPYVLWPFAGRLAQLVAPGRLVLAEAYPAEAMVQRGIPRRGSKRQQEGRRAMASALRQAMAALGMEADAALLAEIAEGFGPRADAEDRFDSLLGLIGVIAVLEGAQPDHVPEDPWILTWEGWVLGQTDAPLDGPSAQ